MKKRVLLVGSLLHEHQFHVAQYPQLDQVALASEYQTLFSSKVVNAGRLMAAHNYVTLCSAVGNDFAGNSARQLLQDSYNIDPQHVQVHDGAPTGHVMVTTAEGGKSAITVYFGASDTITLPETLTEQISSFDLVYATTELPLPLLYRLAALTTQTKTPLFLDVPNRQKELDLKQLRQVPYFSLNRYEAAIVLNKPIETVETAMEAVAQLYQDVDGTIIITLDKDGVVYWDAKLHQAKHIPVEPIDVIDSTGAGDIFRGVVCSEILEGKELSEALVTAQNIARQSVLVKGVSPSIVAAIEQYKKV